jgi:amino acid transporter
LVAVYPRSGGTYTYGRERLGDWWGFTAGWGFVVGKTASCAAMALTFAETYRADTYQLVRAGSVEGKGVPDTVTSHPAAFVTLTALALVRSAA